MTQDQPRQRKPVPPVPTFPRTMSLPAALRTIRLRTGHQLPKSTFYRMVADGRLRSIRIGVRYRITEEALEDWLRLCAAGERT